MRVPEPYARIEGERLQVRGYLKHPFPDSFSDTRQLSFIRWGRLNAEGDDILRAHLGMKPNEIGLLGFFSDVQSSEVALVGTPGDFRALLIDLLARLMEIEA